MGAADLPVAKQQNPGEPTASIHSLHTSAAESQSEGNWDSLTRVSVSRTPLLLAATSDRTAPSASVLRGVNQSRLVVASAPALPQPFATPGEVHHIRHSSSKARLAVTPAQASSLGVSEQGTYTYQAGRPRDNLRPLSCALSSRPFFRSLVHPFSKCVRWLLVIGHPGHTQEHKILRDTPRARSRLRLLPPLDIPGVTSALLHDSTGRPLGPGSQTHRFSLTPVFLPCPPRWTGLT